MREYVEPLYGWDAHIQRRYHAGWFKPDRLSIIEDDDGREVGVLDVRDEGDHLYLSRIEILPEGQGRGLGTAVVTAVLGRGRMVRLDIFPHNVRARRFYERLGFALDREQRREGRLSMHHLGHGNDRARAEEMGSQAAVRLGGMNAPAPRRPRPPEANTVVAYDASWPDRFDAIRRHLLPVFIATGATIEHVGSTSVPSLAAKPIIDINVVVQTPPMYPTRSNDSHRSASPRGGLRRPGAGGVRRVLPGPLEYEPGRRPITACGRVSRPPGTEDGSIANLVWAKIERLGH